MPLTDCLLVERESAGIFGITGTTGIGFPGCRVVGLDLELVTMRAGGGGGTAEEGVVGCVESASEGA
jgi:hypothetical protein